MKKFNLVMTVFSMIFLFSCGTSSESENAEAEVESTTTEIVEASFKVFGNCGMCKDRIEKALTSTEGVESAVWNKETKMLTINYSNSVDLHSLHQVIADAGHDTEMHEAKDEVYNELPGCCQYRDGKSHEGHDH